MRKAKNKKIEKMPFFSVIIPVKNGASRLPTCLDSLKGQNYPPELFEVIISDGLSTDNTCDTALIHGAKIVKNEKQTVAPGRNVGFQNSKGDIVVFTDDDCIMDKSWLSNSTKYFIDKNIGGLTGPTITPDEKTSFGNAVGWIFLFLSQLNMSSHHGKCDVPREVSDIPGCNAFYRREVLESVMPIDEGLLTAEDVEMNFRIKKLGYKLIRVPDVFLYHQRRPTIKRLWKQFYRFAIGRLQVGKRHKDLLKPFHVFAGFGFPLGFGISVAIFIMSQKVFVLLLLLAFLHLILIASLAFFQTRSLAIALNVPFALTIILLSWSFGFLRELILPMKQVEGK